MQLFLGGTEQKKKKKTIEKTEGENMCIAYYNVTEQRRQKKNNPRSGHLSNLVFFFYNAP